MTTATAPAQPENSLWRPMVAAMGKTGSASIASGLLSALGTKIVAWHLGPSSIALLQTLQQLRDGAVTAATGNGRTALVQGASALAGVERREYLRTVALLFAGGTLLIAIALVAAPAQVVRWSRLPVSSEPLLPWLALTVALLSVFVFLTAILNATRDISRLALLQGVSPLIAALLAWPIALAVRQGHPVELIFFLAIPAAAAVIAALWALADRRHVLQEWFEGPGRLWTSSAAHHFLSISGAMLVSGLAATAVLLAVRGSITRQQGLAATGQFDAAWNISMNQATLILSSVQTYYLPTLAAAKSAAERGRQMRGMLLVATLATVPVIVALAALKPLVVEILYSPAFTASPQFLRWTLLGDYLKVSAWVLATPMLAARDLSAFLALDLVAHATFFAAAMLLAGLFAPAESAAIGFCVSYAVYLAGCYAYVRARYGFRLGAAGLSAWLSGFALVLAASASTWADRAVDFPKAAAWMLLAVWFSGGFAFYLRRRAA